MRTIRCLILAFLSICAAIQPAAAQFGGLYNPPVSLPFLTILAGGRVTSPSFIPNSSTVPTNGLYLTAANNPSLAANGTLVFDCTTTVCSGSAQLFAKAGIKVTGNVASIATANSTYLDNASGTARILSSGLDATTNGGFSIISARSDGTNVVTLASASNAGIWTSGQPWTFSNAAIKLTGITTGTNADTVCLAADGTLLIQAAACTISSKRFKDDLGDPKLNVTSILRAIPLAHFKMKEQEMPNGDVNFARPQLGLYAEDVAAADPRLAIYEQDGKTPKAYRETALIGLLVAGWNSHDTEIAAFKAANDDLRATNDNLARRLDALEKRLATTEAGARP